MSSSFGAFESFLVRLPQQRNAYTHGTSHHLGHAEHTAHVRRQTIVSLVTTERLSPIANEAVVRWLCRSAIQPALQAPQRCFLVLLYHRGEASAWSLQSALRVDNGSRGESACSFASLWLDQCLPIAGEWLFGVSRHLPNRCALHCKERELPPGVGNRRDDSEAATTPSMTPLDRVDFHGAGVEQAFDIASVAFGGQILLSQHTWALLKGVPPVGVHMLHAGSIRRSLSQRSEDEALSSPGRGIVDVSSSQLMLLELVPDYLSLRDFPASLKRSPTFLTIADGYRSTPKATEKVACVFVGLQSLGSQCDESYRLGCKAIRRVLREHSGYV